MDHRRITWCGYTFRFLVFTMLLVSFPSVSRAQERTVLKNSVSYVAASVVYINGGREGHIAVGDTLIISRASVRIGSVIITAVSKRSSASQVIAQTVPIIAGDDAVIEKVVEIASSPAPSVVVVQDSASGANTASVPRSGPSAGTPASLTENIVSGRAGLQYIGNLAEDSRLNISQPSLNLRMSVQNLYGSGLVLSFYERTSYDLSDIYNRYGDHTRMRTRVYDLSVQTMDPNAPLNFSIGRISSEYVGALGTFDGGQFVYRYDQYAAGFLYGARVQDRASGFNGDETKGAFFLNMRTGTGVDQYSGTLAYGRQLVKGNLDREFMYLQNFYMMGPELSVYQSSEVELNDINNNVRTRTVKLSNTFLSLNYYPVEWLSTNVGYDGARTVYLFESMKTIADTLLDRTMMQGYRAGATVRLPYFMSVSGNLIYRTKKGDPRDSRNASLSFRIADLLQSDIGAGIRYADIVGVYTSGSNLTLDLDRTFFNALSVDMRYDFYRYTVSTVKQTYTTHTLSVNSSYRLSRSLYTSLAVDGVIDQTVNSMRIFAEFGYRF